ncbi:acyl-CoA dehydrogenase family protein [Zavarzinia sp. CC-PAN008]|uniref:acyl-CoA dehydrogenase family protein n=1 Tax=Zavarzinia sp. CC-PAN008 TaxID=3243332 RepID=UPI003F7434C0
MNFALSDDHILLRDSAAAVLDKEVSHAALLVPGATVADAPYGHLWEKIAELGWPGLIVPEEFGGSGLDCLDLSMILGEMGRTLAPSAFLGSLLGTWALLRCGSPAQKARLLPDVALGRTRLALAAADAHGRTEDGACSVSVGTDGRLSGRSGFVLDAGHADTLVVAARQTDGRRGLFLVKAKAPGVAITILPWRDITRQVAHVDLDGAEGEVLAADDAAHWPWIRDRALMALACESAAGTRQVLDMANAYAKERVAFGKPIGAYQAIKHQLADMLGQVECAHVAVLYAAARLADEAPDGSLAAVMAQAYASDAYVAACRRNIQIFGAIGFTWEMVNHLYLKRALGNGELFGNARQHRARVIDLVVQQKLERAA